MVKLDSQPEWRPYADVRPDWPGGDQENNMKNTILGLAVVLVALVGTAATAVAASGGCCPLCK